MQSSPYRHYTRRASVLKHAAHELRAHRDGRIGRDRSSDRWVAAGHGCGRCGRSYAVGVLDRMPEAEAAGHERMVVVTEAETSCMSGWWW